MRKTLTVRLLAAPVAAVLSLGLLAGCGSDGESGSNVASVGDGKSAGSSSGSGSGKSKSDADQAQAFVDCMRDQGIEMEDPDPKTGKLNLQGLVGGGADRKGLQKGMDACRDKMPQQLKDKADGDVDQGTLQKFAECMRGHGVKMEDPGPEGFDKGSMKQDDPDFQKAMDACREELGGGSGGGQ